MILFRCRVLTVLSILFLLTQGLVLLGPNAARADDAPEASQADAPAADRHETAAHEAAADVSSSSSARDTGQSDAQPSGDRPAQSPAAEPVDASPRTTARGVTAQSQWVGWMELSGPLMSRPAPMAFGGDPDKAKTLAAVLDQMNHVATADDYLGMVIFLDQPELSLAQIMELRRAVLRVRQADRKVLVFAEAYALPTYLLATAADRVLMQKGGQLMLMGLGMEEMYLKQMLDKIGVEADLVQVGQFKGADETLTRSGPSPQWNQNIDSLLDDVYDQILDAVAEGRDMGPDQVEDRFADSFTMADDDAVRTGLIDDLVDRDMVTVTGQVFGDQFMWDEQMGRASRRQNMDNPFAFFRMLFQPSRATVSRQSIAVVHAQGPISSGDSQMRGPQAALFSNPTIGSRTMVRALGDARDNSLIKGVVVRIDSPGGSALASEVIWQAIRDCAAVKPVFVSVGPMAASGGYYIASAGQSIFASPTSIVGSIGVVGGKLAMGGLYDWAGVSVHRRTRGPMADLFNSVEPFTEQQRHVIRKSMQQVYQQFQDRVMTGRKGQINDFDAVAQGRVFTGRQALANGMVDQLGGLNDAILAMAQKLNLDEGQYGLVHLPAPPSLPEILEKVFGVQASGRRGLSGMMMASHGSANPATQAMPWMAMARHPQLAIARAALGPRRWSSIERVLMGITLLQREPTLLLMPHAIAWR